MLRARRRRKRPLDQAVQATVVAGQENIAAASEQVCFLDDLEGVENLAVFRLAPLGPLDWRCDEYRFRYCNRMDSCRYDRSSANVLALGLLAQYHKARGTRYDTRQSSVTSIYMSCGTLHLLRRRPRASAHVPSEID